MYTLNSSPVVKTRRSVGSFVEPVYMKEISRKSEISFVFGVKNLKWLRQEHQNLHLYEYVYIYSVPRRGLNGNKILKTCLSNPCCFRSKASTISYFKPFLTNYFLLNFIFHCNFNVF